MKGLLGLALLVMVGVAVSSVGARSLWPGADDGKPERRNLISDSKAQKVGDVLTIVISERTETTVQAKTSNGQDASTGVEAGKGLLSFIPFLGLGAKDSYQSQGQQTYSGTFTTRVAATIKEIMPNGLLQIEGTRTVDVNGEKQELVLSGVVRPFDIKADNTISSEQIADAQIEYRGAGPIGQKAKPGLLTRLLDFLF